MGQVRCEICHLKLPTSKSLISHYLSGHTKFKLAREIIRLSVLSKMPKIFTKKNKNKTEKGSEHNYRKSETLFINDSVHILCRNNEIIIRDDKSSVDMEFSFDENSSETKENYFVPEIKQNPFNKSVKEVNNNKVSNNSELRKLLKNKNNEPLIKLNASSSSASSEDSTKKFSFKKRIRKRRDLREKAGHYKINITRSRHNQSLNEITGNKKILYESEEPTCINIFRDETFLGNFYQCHCREGNKIKLNSNDLKLASDTESASDTGRKNHFNDPKVFCSKCGNGYRDENMLLEHMKIHETHCRVCNEIFPTEQLFKEHIQSHIFKVFVCHVCNYEFPVKPMLHKHFECHVEDSILESVIDMEEDYNVTAYSLPQMSYQTSINSILCYLGENHDINYYSSKLAKIYCDICLSEVFYSDYEGHMQTVHCIY